MHTVYVSESIPQPSLRAMLVFHLVLNNATVVFIGVLYGMSYQDSL
jgi:hypothetical protein